MIDARCFEHKLQTEHKEDKPALDFNYAIQYFWEKKGKQNKTKQQPTFYLVIFF